MKGVYFMFTVAVKDHLMIAHSLRGAVFGPAQRLHGATFHVTTEYMRSDLDENGIVIDIGQAQQVLAEVLEALRYRNLDDLAEFKGRNTTTEFLAYHLHGEVAEKARDFFQGTLRVVLEESHVAWGSYEAPVVSDAGRVEP
jgi:6-pyruvoyl-tetrahydropterin synthase